MAMAVAYSSFCGQLVHENRGGSSSAYIADTKSSTVAVLDNAGADVFIAEYWPFGQGQNSVGHNASPWNFLGQKNGFSAATGVLVYVDNRNYNALTGQWTSLADPSRGLPQTYALAMSVAMGGVFFDPCMGLLCSFTSVGRMITDVLSLGEYKELEGPMKEFVCELGKAFGKDKLEDILKEAAGWTNDPKECLEDARRLKPKTIVGWFVRNVCLGLFPGSPYAMDCALLYFPDDIACDNCCNTLPQYLQEKCSEWCVGGPPPLDHHGGS